MSVARFCVLLQIIASTVSSASDAPNKVEGTVWQYRPSLDNYIEEDFVPDGQWTYTMHSLGHVTEFRGRWHQTGDKIQVSWRAPDGSKTSRDELTIVGDKLIAGNLQLTKVAGADAKLAAASNHADVTATAHSGPTPNKNDDENRLSARSNRALADWTIAKDGFVLRSQPSLTSVKVGLIRKGDAFRVLQSQVVTFRGASSKAMTQGRMYLIVSRSGLRGWGYYTDAQIAGYK